MPQVSQLLISWQSDILTYFRKSRRFRDIKIRLNYRTVSMFVVHFPVGFKTSSQFSIYFINSSLYYIIKEGNWLNTSISHRQDQTVKNPMGKSKPVGKTVATEYNRRFPTGGNMDERSPDRHNIGGHAGALLTCHHSTQRLTHHKCDNTGISWLIIRADLSL